METPESQGDRVTRGSGGSPRGHTGTAARARPPAQVQLVGTGGGQAPWGRAGPMPGPHVSSPRCPLHGPSGKTRSPGPAVKGRARSGILDLRTFVSTVSRVCIGHGRAAAGRVGAAPAHRGVLSGPWPLPPHPAPRIPPSNSCQARDPGASDTPGVCVFITTEPGTDGHAF